MPIRRETDYNSFTKQHLITEVRKWRKMYAASIEQTRELQWIEVELENYKSYLKDARDKLKKVREERDLALRLLALRLSKFTT